MVVDVSFLNGLSGFWLAKSVQFLDLNETNLLGVVRTRITFYIALPNVHMEFFLSLNSKETWLLHWGWHGVTTGSNST